MRVAVAAVGAECGSLWLQSLTRDGAIYRPGGSGAARCAAEGRAQTGIRQRSEAIGMRHDHALGLRHFAVVENGGLRAYIEIADGGVRDMGVERRDGYADFNSARVDRGELVSI